MSLKIRQAIASHYLRTGEELTITDLAVKIWPESKRYSAQVKLSRIINEDTTYIEVDTINKICNICGVTHDQLFGAKPL